MVVKGVLFCDPSEAHVLEDVNKCVQALQERDPENVDRTAGQIRGRTARLEDVVTAEMENYQQGPYTDNVMRAVMYMRNEGKNSSLYAMKSIFGSTSVSGQLPTYPSPNPTLTLTCYQLTVLGLGEG